MPYVKCDNCGGVSHMNFADPEKNLTAKTVDVCGRCYKTPEGKRILKERVKTHPYRVVKTPYE